MQILFDTSETQVYSHRESETKAKQIQTSSKQTVMTQTRDGMNRQHRGLRHPATLTCSHMYCFPEKVRCRPSLATADMIATSDKLSQRIWIGPMPI